MVTKIVNGHRVELTPYELAEFQNRAAIENAVSNWRSTASLTRAEFLVACVSSQILTKTEAETAADGTWPASFSAFISGLALPDKLAARAAWADGDVIRRSHPLVASLASSLSMTDAQVDALFGWAE